MLHPTLTVAQDVLGEKQPDTAPLHNIEVTHPLELVHLDYLQIEPSKGNTENVLIVTDHFTRYAQAYPSKSQTALATAKLLWNNFVIHYGFPDKIISDQGRNFQSELLANLFEVAGVQKLRTTPYHPQTNGQCERFNSTHLNMLGTLTPEQKKDWKTYVPAMVHAYNCTRNTATVIVLIIYCLEESLDSPLMLNLDLKGEDNRAPLASPPM